MFTAGLYHVGPVVRACLLQDRVGMRLVNR